MRKSRLTHRADALPVETRERRGDARLILLMRGLRSLAYGLLMAATDVIFGLVTSYPVLLVAAFFGTLGTSASETAPFLPIDQAMLAQVIAPERRTALFARYNLVAQFCAAQGALVAGVPLASGIHLLTLPTRSMMLAQPLDSTMIRFALPDSPGQAR